MSWKGGFVSCIQHEGNCQENTSRILAPVVFKLHNHCKQHINWMVMREVASSRGTNCQGTNCQWLPKAPWIESSCSIHATQKHFNEWENLNYERQDHYRNKGNILHIDWTATAYSFHAINWKQREHKQSRYVPMDIKHVTIAATITASGKLLPLHDIRGCTHQMNYKARMWYLPCWWKVCMSAKGMDAWRSDTFMNRCHP